MSTKDYFSGHSKLYATFRPTYPDALYQFIFKHLQSKSVAWDCATGNGQVAQYLSCHFDKVLATDISQQQLDNAFQASNILYSVSPAEKTGFKNQSIDLITVAQALHWFTIEDFYKEVNRVAKPGAILAIWGYNVLSISPDVDKIIEEFYLGTTGPYWDERRKLIDDEYKSIAFPFEDIHFPKIEMTTAWSLEHLTGYLTTWSATQKFIKVNGFDPVIPVYEKLKSHWKDGELKEVRFPLFGKIGRI
jgi:ubiquinone/menaquinone biosynthesis C-methylase UbiE